jgi:hypothetical protein
MRSLLRGSPATSRLVPFLSSPPLPSPLSDFPSSLSGGLLHRAFHSHHHTTITHRSHLARATGIMSSDTNKYNPFGTPSRGYGSDEPELQPELQSHAERTQRRVPFAEPDLPPSRANDRLRSLFDGNTFYFPPDPDLTPTDRIARTSDISCDSDDAELRSFAPRESRPYAIQRAATSLTPNTSRGQPATATAINTDPRVSTVNSRA